MQRPVKGAEENWMETLKCVSLSAQHYLVMIVIMYAFHNTEHYGQSM